MSGLVQRLFYEPLNRGHFAYRFLLIIVVASVLLREPVDNSLRQALLLLLTIYLISITARRCRDFNVSTGKIVIICIIMCIPFMTFFEGIYLCCKKGISYYQDNDYKMSNSQGESQKNNIINFALKKTKQFWALVFCIISLLMLLFYVPYKTTFPATFMRNNFSYTSWNGTIHYGTFSTKPNIEKAVLPYTDISYGRLALQEVILVVACSGGYIFMVSKRQ